MWQSIGLLVALQVSGGVGFAESLGDIKRTQIFCILMGFGFTWLLMQHVWRTSKTISQMRRQEYELQGIRVILCERGIVLGTGRRSWQGIKLVIGKESLALLSSIRVYLAIPKTELSEEQISQIRIWMREAKKAEARGEKQEDQSGICWVEVKKMCLLGFLNMGIPVIALSFSLVLGLIEWVLSYRISDMLWSVLLGVVMGIILLEIVSTLEIMLNRCIWSVDEAKTVDPNAPEMELYQEVFPKREISEEEARELFPDIDTIYTISCKHGRIIMYGYQGFIVLYKNIGRAL
ncbi:hypothetical protein [Stomatobaculum longum]|uniref:hypothetical protein n=1 Tax=Stomatobaculum longum TaxID=796942 RepID=UPI00288034C3|nr:hypothetical protein [Stomatobaculum longum]